MSEDTMSIYDQTQPYHKYCLSLREYITLPVEEIIRRTQEHPIRPESPPDKFGRSHLYEDVLVEQERKAICKQGVIHTVYVYLPELRGVQYPAIIPITLFDDQLTYSDCYELWENLDYKDYDIEYWTELGVFETLQVDEPLSVAGEMIILRPGGQSRNYMRNCVGFRELTYEAVFRRPPGLRQPIPVRYGICPTDDENLLELSSDWKTSEGWRAIGYSADFGTARGLGGTWVLGEEHKSIRRDFGTGINADVVGYTYEVSQEVGPGARERWEQLHRALETW